MFLLTIQEILISKILCKIIRKKIIGPIKPDNEHFTLMDQLNCIIN